MSSLQACNLESTFVRLRADGSTQTLPVDATFWSQLASGALGDFHREYLVSCVTYDRDWSSWERHPHGDELVCLLGGQATVLLERAGTLEEICVRSAGDFLVVPRNTWHTAHTNVPTTMLFVTPGEGTEHRSV